MFDLVNGNDVCFFDPRSFFYDVVFRFALGFSLSCHPYRIVDENENLLI